MISVEWSEVADVTRAISSILWVLFALVVLLVFRKVLADRGSLSKLGVGPGGVTMEFAERKLDEALANADDSVKESVGLSAKRTVIERIDRLSPLLSSARILWVDDHPENNTPIVQLFERYGATVDVVVSNSLAMRRLQGTRYDAVISDVSRDNEPPGTHLRGIELADEVFARTGQQVVLFTARFDPATLPGVSDAERLQLVQRVQRSVFGRTSRTDELLHLVLDLLER